MRNLNLLARDTLDFTQQTTVAGSAEGGGGGMKNTKKKEKQWGKKENTRSRARSRRVSVR